ncbi:MAG: hypothetical protein ABI691_11150 [Ginsengibacter sp.]
MKKLTPLIATLFIFISCNNDKKIIVDRGFIDSLISNYTEPVAIKFNKGEIEFWGKRINPANPGFVNETKYAGALAVRFHLKGDIKDIKLADSVLYKVDSDFDHKEAAPLVSLASHAITQHQFKKADSLLEMAKKIGLKKYESIATSFDVDFELGRYDLCANELRTIRSSNDYGYFFRKSKFEHYKGNLDSSIKAMLTASDLAGESIPLKQAALSNAADLYIHSGKLQKAADLYMESIHLSASDLHSITGLGWIALVHDKNDSLATKIFEFVHSKSQAPDPLFKLSQVAEATGDSSLQLKYAKEFAKVTADSAYGNMYNKYLIELYTGILNDPTKAEFISKKELTSRATPQTYAWYVWSLFSNDKKEQAYSYYEKFVSGKPLEGLELYYMGKMMQALKKGYNAQQFFKAAFDNKYDLSPSKVKDLEAALKE